MTVEQIYERHVKPLSSAERLRLLELTAHDLAQPANGSNGTSEAPKHSLLELEGLGAEIWEGIDVAQYINEMRDEWDRKP